MAVKINRKQPLEEARKKVATEAVMQPHERNQKVTRAKPAPKSVTRITQEDECSDEEAFGQEMKNADARSEGGDVPE